MAELELSQALEPALPATAGEVRLHAPAEEIPDGIARIQDVVTRAGRTPVTIGHLEELEQAFGSSLPALLRRLREAGVHAIASASIDRLQDAEASVLAAKEAGLPIARFVVRQAATDGPWDVLGRVRALQISTGAVRSFAPLSREEDAAQPSTGYFDVKIVALARLALDGVASIQVDWARHGPKLAQVALIFGADDLDAVSPDGEGADGRRRAPLEEVRRNILAASLTPVERDGSFERRAPA